METKAIIYPVVINLTKICHFTEKMVIALKDVQSLHKWRGNCVFVDGKTHHQEVEPLQIKHKFNEIRNKNLTRFSTKLNTDSQNTGKPKTVVKSSN